MNTNNYTTLKKYRNLETGLLNFIKPDGTLLSKEWFKYIEDFKDGFALVIKNKRYNFIKPDGTFLSTNWFKKAKSFRGGFAAVQISRNHWNFIKPDGSLLSNHKFKTVNNFSEGFAAVEVSKGKWTFIKSDGTLLYKDIEYWLEDAHDFREGLAAVKFGGWNYLKTDGTFLFTLSPFIRAEDFSNGVAIVFFPLHGYYNIHTAHNIINKEGEFLSEHLKSISGFNKWGLAQVKTLYGEENFLKTNGEFLCKNNFYRVYFFTEEGIALVQKKENVFNYIKLDGSLLSPTEDFSEADHFCNGLAQVKKRGSIFEYYINCNGELYY